MTIMELFEEFCIEYNLDYDFKKIGNGLVYSSEETAKAHIIFKYSRSYRKEFE